MADVKWIKLAVDIFDNRKIKQIERMPEGDALIVVWLKLLVLAGNINDSGMVYFTRDIPYTEQLLSVEFNRPLPVIQLALATFQKFGMIEIVSDLIRITNWEKYQNLESLDKIREQNRNRVAAFRARQRLAIEAGNVTGNVTVTQSNAIEEERREKKEEKEKNKNKNKNKRFTPPTLEDVQAYCRERGNRVDAKKFFDYYNAGEWHDSQGKPVRNWKQKLLRWEKDDTPQPVIAKRGMQRDTIEDDWASDIMNRPRAQG